MIDCEHPPMKKDVLFYCEGGRWDSVSFQIKKFSPLVQYLQNKSLTLWKTIDYEQNYSYWQWL